MLPFADVVLQASGRSLDEPSMFPVAPSPLTDPSLAPPDPVFPLPPPPYFDLVKSVEAESLFDFRAAADKLMMSVSEINRAELRALTAAAQLD